MRDWRLSYPVTMGHPIRRVSQSLKGWARKLLGATEASFAFKTGLAAGLSLILGSAFAEMFDRPDFLIGGLWSVMASIVVMQARLGGTYSSAWIRFLGVLIGSAAGVFCLYFCGNSAFSLAAGVFFTIVLCALLNIKESFRIAALSTAIVVIAGGGLHSVLPPWLFGWYRFVDSCIGILVAIAVASIVWPEKAIENIRMNVEKVLNLLSKFYLGAAGLDSNTSEHLQASESLLSEIEDLLQQNRDNRKEAELELFNNQEKYEHWVLITEQLEGILSAVNSLRNIQKDTVAKICDDDLVNRVADTIDKTNMAFQSLEKVIIHALPQPDFVDALAVSLHALNDDLLRFRGTRTTRRFGLEDLENFYLFFHSLRTVGETLIKISKTLG